MLVRGGLPSRVVRVSGIALSQMVSLYVEEAAVDMCQWCFVCFSWWRRSEKSGKARGKELAGKESCEARASLMPRPEVLHPGLSYRPPQLDRNCH